MKNSFLSTYFSISFLFIFSCFSFLHAQNDSSLIDKIEHIRSTPDFSTKNTEYIDLLLELAKKKVRTNPDSTIILLEQANKLSKNINYKYGESIALSTYGYYFFEKGETEKAFENNQKALKMSEKHNLNEPKLRALNNMGLDYWIQGEAEKALPMFLEALSVAKIMNKIDMIISLNINISNIYSENGDFNTAESFLNTAREMSTKIKDEEVLAFTQLNMALEYSKIGNLNEAENIVDLSIKYFEKKGVKDWLAHAYEQKGSIEIKNKNYNNAIIWLKKSESICDEIDFKYGHALVYNGLAKSYLGVNNLENAKNYGIKSLEVSKELNIATTIKESNETLYQVYQKLGKYEMAFSHQQKYLELFKKETEEKFKKGLGLLRAKTNFENQKKQLILEQTKTLEKHKNYTYLAVGVLIISLITLFSIVKTTKLQKKFNQKLKFKQEALLVREAELSELNKTKDKLFSLIAHDLKGPINSLYELLKLYVDEPFSQNESKTFFTNVLNETQRLSDMLNNLLIWAKTQMNGINIKQENLNIYNAAQHSIILLKPLSVKKNIKIINKIPKEIITYSDKAFLSIIFRNLITNALKFTDVNGKIELLLVNMESLLQIKIKDNGIGMTEDVQHKLFKTEHIKSTYGTQNEKGTGLGLSICKDLINKNGGEIWVKSKVNMGTEFCFTIPKEKLNN
ncbi:tetratricopeptide repeat-containing sensor histidine kinase [Neotamlana laminarinivorans]|uniref:histidine kinase n=1 Tax=Neotamlana laminarinivorans TaxID=2883124 RepID=A0A9X1HZV2_9FLAO|nr:tetratricopeptide repeat protein [Tamlana laminarinivorans]MCB4797707.1 tetratricopeptide repeat-containing sensor histidine kinase [Tamlana laminarinivorans]